MPVQTAEQRRVGRHQSLQVGDGRVRVGRRLGCIGSVDATNGNIGEIVKDDADISEIGVRSVRGRGAGGKSCRRCEKSGRTILCRQRSEVGIVIDDIKDIEMARVQRAFLRRRRCRMFASIHRGRGCR